jgi:hypothetical protein
MLYIEIISLQIMGESLVTFYMFVKTAFRFYVKATKSDTTPFFERASRVAHVFGSAVLEGFV